MIHVFKKDQWVKSLRKYQSWEVPNGSYLLDKQHEWWHQELDRVIRISAQEVPKEIRTAALLVV